MNTKAPQTTDDYIRILKEFDDHEKLRIINALTESMLNPPEKETEESMEEFLKSLTAWKEDGESAEETIAKIRNARCSGVTRHIDSFDD